MSAVLAGVKDVRRSIDEAELHADRQTVLFVDEGPCDLLICVRLAALYAPFEMLAFLIGFPTRD